MGRFLVLYTHGYLADPLYRKLAPIQGFKALRHSRLEPVEFGSVPMIPYEPGASPLGCGSTLRVLECGDGF